MGAKKGPKPCHRKCQALAIVADYRIPIATAKESALSDALIEEFIKEMRNQVVF